MPHSTFVREAAPPRGGFRTSLLATLWVGAVCVAWWAVMQRQLQDLDLSDALAAAGIASAARATAVIAVTSTLSRLGATALEAVFYWSWWRMWGDRFRFGRMFVAIASLSLIDAWAVTLQSLVRAHVPDLMGVLAPVLGLGLARPLPSPGAAGAALAGGGGAWGVAFGTLGLTTLLRVALTARVFAGETGRRFATPLALVASAWIVTRVALGFGLDLVRGASPLP